MILEDGLNFRVERWVLCRIAEQIPNHADVAGVGELDHRNYIGTRLLERGMDRIPSADPAMETAASGDFLPSEVEGAAVVTDPFGAPLELAAFVAALDNEFVAFGGVPVFFIETGALSSRSW